MPRKEKLIVILGPTASGKTELAIKLAKEFNGEIISADSRQIYKEMDIGTAKPTEKEKKEVHHHLIDLKSPNEEFNVSLYKKVAIKKIKKVIKKGKIPFLVGGTGLYISAICDNLDFPGVPPNKELREKLEKKDKEELFKIYKKLDPEGAKYIDKDNKRRLIRAIEVSKITKKSFWKQRKKRKPLFDILKIGIKRNKEELEKRIEERVKKMIKIGLEKEARNLFQKYGNIPSLETIGYQEWRDFFEGKKRKEEVIKEIILHTKQYTRRQMTWFKKDKKIHWIKTLKEAEELIKNFLENKKERA